MSGTTIAAIATAPGRGGVAIVRVSGPDAFAIAGRLTGRPVVPGRIAFRRIFHSSTSTSNIDSYIDEAVVLAFRSPHSYTGEDVVEIQCHGGSVTPRRILDACLAAGAQIARRGEFTERAFLNGRIDYDQAASVLDLIDAKTERAADAALEGLSGLRTDALRLLYEDLLGISAELEHALDVDESELPGDFFDKLSRELSDRRSEMQNALRREREGRILRDGAVVVLAGPPNAGKSSLLNALLREDRAIVSATPGTTRDSIEAWLDVDGWPVRLVDTAGIRETDDAIEAEGVRRSEDLVRRADVVVALDGCDPLPSAIRVHAKCDLDRREEALNVSAKTGEGLDLLRRAIAERLEAKAESLTDGATGGTHADALVAALGALPPLPLGPESDPVLVANAVRASAETLGAELGASYSADLLDRLFSRFCVGK